MKRYIHLFIRIRTSRLKRLEEQSRTILISFLHRILFDYFDLRGKIPYVFSILKSSGWINFAHSYDNHISVKLILVI